MKRSAHPEGRGRREAAGESNVIAEFDASPTVPAAPSPRLAVSYAWGLDLSGTTTGAGGVGGLLFTKLHSAPGAPVLAPCYDGNGNILAYLDCATGQTLARYEYDPFGKLLLKDEDGRVAGRLHHQFSTKYCDAETGLAYYGYRYYAPELGRWVNRDPIGEKGGLGLYALSGNDVVNRVDILGRYLPAIAGGVAIGEILVDLGASAFIAAILIECHDMMEKRCELIRARPNKPQSEYDDEGNPIPLTDPPLVWECLFRCKSGVRMRFYANGCPDDIKDIY